MPLAVLAAGGGYEWVQLHDAKGERHKLFKQFTFLVVKCEDTLVKITARRHI